MELFILNNKDIIIENAIFSFLPMTSILVARHGLKTWLKFEIFVTILNGLIFVFNPSTVFKIANWNNVS